MEWTETGRFPCRFAQPDLVPVEIRGNTKIVNISLNGLEFDMNYREDSGVISSSNEVQRTSKTFPAQKTKPVQSNLVSFYGH